MDIKLNDKKQFRKKFNKIKTLDHINILKFIDHRETDEFILLITEFVKGDKLFSFM